MFVQQDKGFIDGIARVKNEGKWGFLKPDGTVVGNQWFENAELFSKTAEKNTPNEVVTEKAKPETKAETKPAKSGSKPATKKKK